MECETLDICLCGVADEAHTDLRMFAGPRDRGVLPQVDSVRVCSGSVPFVGVLR